MSFLSWDRAGAWLLPPAPLVLGRVIILGKVYGDKARYREVSGTPDELMAMVNNRAKYELRKTDWDDSVQQTRARQIIDEWLAKSAAQEFASNRAFADTILDLVKDLPEGVPIDPRAMPAGAKVSAPDPSGLSYSCSRKPVTIPDEEGDRLLVLADAEGTPITGPKGTAVLGEDGRPLWVRMVASTTKRGALTWTNAVFDGTKRAAYNRAIKNIPDAAKLKFGEQMIPVVRDGKVTDATTPGMSREAAEWASRERISVRGMTRENLSNQGRRFSEWADKSLKFEEYFAKYLDRLYKIKPEALEALKATDSAAAAAMERAVYKEIVKAAAKSRWWVSGSSTVMRVAGPVALIVGAGFSVERIASASDADRAIVIVDEGASWAGSLGGAYVGAEAGALGFAWAGPPRRLRRRHRRRHRRRGRGRGRAEEDPLLPDRDAGADHDSPAEAARRRQGDGTGLRSDQGFRICAVASTTRTRCGPSSGTDGGAGRHESATSRSDPAPARPRASRRPRASIASGTSACGTRKRRWPSGENAVSDPDSGT